MFSRRFIDGANLHLPAGGDTTKGTRCSAEVSRRALRAVVVNDHRRRSVTGVSR